jgi:hypothetical protein
MKPKRIQRKRSKGWRKPENTVYVGRGSKWGNPFKIMGEGKTGWLYAFSINRKILDPYILVNDHYNNTQNDAVKMFAKWLRGKLPAEKFGYLPEPPTKEEIKKNLKGKNLMCWCSIDSPCHADILLQIANN